MSLIWTLGKAAAISAAVPLAISLGLIASQRPGPLPQGGLDFAQAISGGAVDLPATPVPMRDGWVMPVRQLAGPEGAPLVILIHGSGWQGQQFARLGPMLAAHADVAIPDLRGHGAAPARRGDVNYVGQMEDDLADLITALRREGQRVVLAGHSSGGGLVVRFAGGAHRAMMDGAVLMAPFLQHDAPVTRPKSGGWAYPLTRRIIGLSMLNGVGIRALDHLTVIRFAMPQTVLDGPLGATATTAYSWRLNKGFGPRRDYLKDVAALPRFLLIAGTADAAFDAPGYQPLMSAVTDKGRYVLVEGSGHLGLVDAPQTLMELAGFLDAF
jgi:alpha-beta hydrolase superfamily lysophospholipase